MQHPTVVLSSGFLAFASHIGFAKGAHCAGVVPARLCGTSSGAVIAALWASGASPDAMIKLVTSLPPWRLLRLRAPWGSDSRAVVTLDAFVNLLTQHLPRRFEDLPIPFSCGVVDRKSNTPTLLSSGDLCEAVVASCAIPYLFAPRQIGGRTLHDGGAIDRLFLGPLLATHPASQVLAHVVDGSPVRNGARSVEQQLIDAASKSNVLVVRSPRSGANFFSLGQVAEQIEGAAVRTQRAVTSTSR